MICVRDNLDKRPCPKLTSYTYIVMLGLSIIICLDVISLCDGQKPINLGGVKRRDVYIAGFFPYGRHVPESHVGRGVMPSVKLAVDHINDNPTILRNYRLHMWWNDTEVRDKYFIKIIFNFNQYTILFSLQIFTRYSALTKILILTCKYTNNIYLYTIFMYIIFIYIICNIYMYVYIYLMKYSYVVIIGKSYVELLRLYWKKKK